MAFSGDTAVIGARADDDTGTGSGSAYVYRYAGSSWVQEAKLLVADGAPGGAFGYSVAFSGDTGVIGAQWDDANGSSSGSAYVFRFDGSRWVQGAKLLASDGATGDRFGLSVAISGDTTVIGADRDNDNGTDSGSAYVFSVVGGADGDGVADTCDPCPNDNPDDTDGDGVCESNDICPGTPIGLLVDEPGCILTGGPCCFPAEVCIDDTDTETCKLFPGGRYHGDGLTCDGDGDGDGVPGCDDACPTDPSKSGPGVCGCGVPDNDSDGDGFADCADLCPTAPTSGPANDCGCPEVGTCCSAAGGGCLDNVERDVCSLIGAVYQGDDSVCAGGCGVGDFDTDGDVDLSDFAEFQRCFTSAAGGTPPECSTADVDRCGTIDLGYFNAFLPALTGP